MDWLEIGKKIAAIGLPTLGTIVGGPAGAAIGGLLGKAILGEEEVTQENMLKAMGDPESIMKMKQFEMEHKLELEKLLVEQERLRLADVMDARNRQVRSEEATGKRDYNLYALAWLIVVGFFALIGVLLFAPDALSKEEWTTILPVITMLFGAMSAGFGQVLQYFFGSSKSSQDKTNLLAKAEPVK